MNLMRIYLLTFSLLFAMSVPTQAAQVKRQKYYVDSIQVTVYGSEGTDIITASDVRRPGLDGSSRTLDDLVYEKLMYQDALKYHMLPDTDAIDKHLKSVQREHNLTLDQLKGIFKSAGYSYEEGRAQFGVMTAVNQVIGFKIGSRLVVSEQEINCYYDAHPEVIETSYQLQRVVVPFDTLKSKNILKNNLTAYAKTGKTKLSIDWSMPFWINESDVASEKKHIFALDSNKISNPTEIEDGFELFKLLQKKEAQLRPLQERYREIANLLRQPKQVQLLEEYKIELKDNSSVVYMQSPVN